MRQIALLFSMLVLWSTPSFPSRWNVEKDGSGDYSIIQDAVDAAASGDTILIGPGRFNDQQIRTCIGETDSVRIFIPHDVLTLIGAGPEITIVGQDQPWDLAQSYHVGVFADPSCGNNILNIDGIRFENMGFGLYAGSGIRSTIKDCVFAGNSWSIHVLSDTTRISGCQFDGMARNGFFVSSHFQEFFQMDNCNGFAPLPLDKPWRQTHVHFEGTRVANIDQCIFRNGFGGISVSGGVCVSARNCEFSEQNGYGIVMEANGPPVVVLKDCTFSEQYLAFRQDSGYGRWEIERTTVTDVTLATLGFGMLGGGYIRDSILAKGERYVVMDYLGLDKKLEPDLHFDMTDNWWGTTNPDSIQAWIFDGKDDPTSGFIIDWQPYKGEPVSTEKKSLGSFRAMFR